MKTRKIIENAIAIGLSICYNEIKHAHGENNMRLTSVATLSKGANLQDGAFFGDIVFRFDGHGHGRVYDASALGTSDECIALPLIGTVSLVTKEGKAPHSNAVMFGTQFYEEGDEFPLLYSNVYNSFSKEKDIHEGECYVYRIVREGSDFSATLVQIIKIGFVKDGDLWYSNEEYNDIRPYGNFVLDNENHLYHAFTMRDATRTMRFFTFREPSVCDGVLDEVSGVRTLTLTKEDILTFFDTEYFNFIQGATCEGGLIYSTEGFNKDVHPCIRVIDPTAKRTLVSLDLYESGFPYEAELIGFHNGICYYGDAEGELFRVDFD